MMQLGTRWQAHGPIPAAVPAVLHPALAAAEASAAGDAPGSWTLTFLEGRAIAEYVPTAPDDGATGIELSEAGDGTVHTTLFPL